MAINFPDSPTDGQQFQVGGRTFLYNATKDYWYVKAPTDITVDAESGLTFDGATKEIGLTDIPNTKLANSDVTIDGHIVPLGGTLATNAIKNDQFSSSGIMTTDGSGNYTVSSDNSNTWDTAAGWGDHAAVGYRTDGGGTADFEAAEAISEGDTVALKTDGKIEKIIAANVTDFVGIATEAISNGSTGTVTISGGVNTSQSGLTVGQEYWLASDGTLSASATDNVVIGKALSATNIIVRHRYGVVDGDLLPDNASRSIGSLAEPFSDLYISEASIWFGAIRLGAETQEDGSKGFKIGSGDDARSMVFFESENERKGRGGKVGRRRFKTGKQKASPTDDEPTIAAEEADKLETPRNIQLQGDVTGTFEFDGSADVNFSTSFSSNSIESGHIKSNQILSAHIKNGNVTNSHLEDDSLTINTGTGLSGGGSVELGRSRTISHGDTSSVSNSSNSGNTFIKNITFDTYGHVATIASGSIDIASFVDQSDIDASVNALESKLVNDAPTALNTLNELAAALNDNPDTITNLVTVVDGKAAIGHTHDDRYYTESEIDSKLNLKANTHSHPYLGSTAKAVDSDKLDGNDSSYFAVASDLTSRLAGKSNTNHTHDYSGTFLGLTAKAADSDKLDGNDSSYFAVAHSHPYASSSHSHNGLYYTESEINDLLDDKSDNHTHPYLGLTAKAADSDKLDGNDSTYFATAGHNHNSTYYTESEVNSLLAGKSDTHSHPYASSTGYNKSNWDTAYTHSQTAHAPSNANYFSGSYTNLTNKPSIPTDNSQIGNSVGYITDGNHYTVHNAWFQAQSNNELKLYGGGKMVTFRTDGNAGGTGHTGYAYKFTYGGDSSSNSLILIHTDGRIWSKSMGWLNDYFAIASHTHDGTYAPASHSHNYLGLTAKAADSNLLDGLDSSHFATASALTSGLAGKQAAGSYAAASHSHNYLPTTLSSGYTVGMGDWGFRNTTPHGHIQFGPANASHAHIYTNSPNFYFNKELLVLGNTVVHAGSIGSQSVNYANSAGSANAVAWSNISSVPSTFTPASHNHDSSYLGISAKAADSNLLDGLDSSHFATATALTSGLAGKQAAGNYTTLNSVRSLGNAYINDNTPTATTAQFIQELDDLGAFDSYTSFFKTPWSYAGNSDISDTGLGTNIEMAGTSGITWTDNSSDSERGLVTVLLIRPNTGSGPGGVFIYNNQTSGYSPGWREVWTSYNFADNSDNWNTAYTHSTQAHAPSNANYFSGNYNDLSNRPSIPSLSGYATQSYVNSEISDLVGGAGSALDTLKELGDALSDESDAVSALTTVVAGKAAASHSHSYLPYAGGTLTGNINSTNINMQNHSLVGVNNIDFNDPGPDEGLKWVGGNDWKIYESPDDLTTNSGGNLQFVTGNTHKFRIDTSGNITASGSISASGYNNSNWNTAYTHSQAAHAPSNANYISSAPTFTDVYTNSWFRNNSSGTGLYNQATSQHFYSDNDDYWNIAGGTSANGLRMRDEHAGTIRGTFYANNSSQVGILDSGGNWRVQATTSGGNLYGSWTIDGDTIIDAGNIASQTVNHATTATTANAVAWNNVSSKPSTFAPSSHSHNDLYYTESEVNSLLSGKQAAGSYASSGHTHSIDDINSGTITTAKIHTYQSNDDITSVSGNQSPLQVYQDTTNSDAFMAFHTSGDYALYFGLDGGTNKLSVGGWSMGAVSHEIYHAGNKPSLATLGYTGATNANYIADSSSNWNTAYGWGNHASAGYASSSHNHNSSYYTESEVNSLLAGKSDTHSHPYVSTTNNSSLNTDTRNTRGPTRMYRRDSDSDYSVQTYWTGTYWHLKGYVGDSLHAGVQVDYANNSNLLDGNDSSYFAVASHSHTVTWGDVTGKPTIPTNNNQLSNGAGYITSYTDTNTWRPVGTGASDAMAGNTTIPTNNNQLTNGAGYITSANGGNATTLDGLDLHTGRNNNANKVVRTQANGYIDAGWINTLSGDAGTNTMDRIYASYDGYIRYMTPSNFANQILALGGTTKNSHTHAWGDVSGKPTIPTNNNQLTNGAGYITSYTDTNTWRPVGTGASDAMAGNTTIPTNTNQLTNGSGYVTSSGITSVSAGGGNVAATSGGSVTVSHADTSNQANVNNSGQTFIQDLTFDTYGHVTGVTSATASGGGGDVQYLKYGGSNKISAESTGATVTGELRVTADIIAYYSSDRKFKDNLKAIEEPIEKIKKLTGYTFTWNDKQTTYPLEGQDVGVVAQEVQEVMPEIVAERDDESLAVKYEKMVPLLIEAIKEQQTQIEDLTKQVEELRNAYTI